MDWIDLDQNRDNRQAIVNRVTKLSVSSNAEIFLLTELLITEFDA
jgi:hypothetical protein